MRFEAAYVVSAGKWTCVSLHQESEALTFQLKLKGYSTNFTHQDQFTNHGECYSACENSCIMSSVALEEFCKATCSKSIQTQQGQEQDGIQNSQTNKQSVFKKEIVCATAQERRGFYYLFVFKC